MDANQLQILLEQEESATLEFKSEPYWIDHKDNKVKNRQRDELIKDILALANGNSVVAGDVAYLVIGADNKIGDDGKRDVHDIGEYFLSRRRLLDIVNPACSPKLEDIDSEIVELDGRKINVITIHPTPHLFETTRRLEPSTAKGSFSEYVVFVRHNESVRIASGKERDAIAKLKKIRLGQIKNPPAEPFGAVVGASIGAIALGSVAEKILDNKEGARAAGTVAGIIFGGSVGFMIGNTFKSINEIKNDWYRMPSERKPLALFSAFMVSLITFSQIRSLIRKKQKE